MNFDQTGLDHEVMNCMFEKIRGVDNELHYKTTMIEFKRPVSK